MGRKIPWKEGNLIKEELKTTLRRQEMENKKEEKNRKGEST